MVGSGTLPLLIHWLGGGRDALPSRFLDGTHICHYRLMPLLFAREGDHVVDTLGEVAAISVLPPFSSRGLIFGLRAISLRASI